MVDLADHRAPTPIFAGELDDLVIGNAARKLRDSDHIMAGRAQVAHDGEVATLIGEESHASSRRAQTAGSSRISSCAMVSAAKSTAARMSSRVKRVVEEAVTHEPELPYPAILRAVVGSTVHGLNVEDSIEDRDEMGICVEDYEAAHGLRAPFEQYIYRSAAIREGRPDAKSYAGDLDLVVYSLRKWLRLALNGNPTILLLLFAPPIQCDGRGSQLRELAPAIVSRRAGGAFLGYLDAQRQRLTGERGGKDVNSEARRIVGVAEARNLVTRRH